MVSATIMIFQIRAVVLSTFLNRLAPPAVTRAPSSGEDRSDARHYEHQLDPVARRAVGVVATAVFVFLGGVSSLGRFHAAATMANSIVSPPLTNVPVLLLRR